MDAYKIVTDAEWKIDHNEISLGEYNNMVELCRDVEAVVRCGECKFKRLYDGETKYYYCALEDRPNRHWSVDDWNYCYWGERRESE